MICIYAIINILDDKHYVGQAEDRDYRWREHRKQLKGFYHHSILLQRAWCKYGPASFIFVILEVLDDVSKLNDRETHWGKLLEPEYNIAPLGGSMRGYKHTEEARKNMSKAHLGKSWHTEESKRLVSERMKGNAWNKGRKQSPEHVEARAKAHRGKIVSAKTKMKQSWAITGFKHSEETKQRMSEAAKKKQPISEVTRKKLSEAAFRQWNGS